MGLRKIGSAIGQVALGAVVATMAVILPVGLFASSNLFWGEDNQYGRVPIPGTQVVHIPAGQVTVSVAVALPGRGNGTPTLRLPDVGFSIEAVDGGGPEPKVTEDVGDSQNTNDARVDTQRQVWRMSVAREADYKITTHGDFTGYGVNPEMWFGYTPGLPGAYVPVVSALIGLCASLLWFGFRLLRRRRTQSASPGMEPWTDPHSVKSRGEHRPRMRPEPSRPRAEKAASHRPTRVQQLRELADLHQQGELTDAEYAAEKARLLGER